MLKWAHYARKLDIGLLCPNTEIWPQVPINGIFLNFFIFVERFPDFASNEPSTIPQTLSLNQVTLLKESMATHHKSNRNLH